VTSLQVDSSSMDTHNINIAGALAQLTSISHLAFTPHAAMSNTHLSTIACLTSLTSLEVAATDWEQPASAALQQALQQLAQLRHLHSLKLGLTTQVSYIYAAGGAADRIPVPAWPHMQHLSISAPEYEGRSLQLTAQQCAQLRSLACMRFQPAPGVSSMDQLQELVLTFKLQPLPVGPPSQGGLPTLQYPQLKTAHLGTVCESVLEALVSGAPAITAIEALHMGYWNFFTGALQSLSPLLTQLLPLRSLTLPGSALHLDWTGWLSESRSQSRLQSLHVQSPVQPAQLLQLRSCASLRELSLDIHPGGYWPVLSSLPPQLTAFTCIISMWSAVHGAAASSTIPQLHVHRVDLPVQVLPLSRLTGLTSLVLQIGRLSSAQQADISRLTQLVELQSHVWPGMAQQLAGLQGLQKVTLGSGLGTPEQSTPVPLRELRELRELQHQVGQWAALTQLRELTLVTGFGPPRAAPAGVAGGAAAADERAAAVHREGDVMGVVAGCSRLQPGVSAVRIDVMDLLGLGVG
jgi:hypothetical protein